MEYKVKKKVIFVVSVLALVCVMFALPLIRSAGEPSGNSFRTSEIVRGDLVLTVNATGTVEPEEVIDVGAQVAGQIVSFGKDIHGQTVDYRSEVVKGTVLARIDDALFKAEVDEAEAGVQSAEASLKLAKAELLKREAKQYQTASDWQRAQNLGSSEILSQESFDAYKSAYEVANADVAVSKASILQAEADVARSEASLQRAKRNLGYCTIASPVKGVIIDCRVNIGQTVVASLNAPSLFLLAKDLKRMQVWAAINEADIGKLFTGQHVTFTVDALPGEAFEGEIGVIRLNASMTQNVVMYTVEVTTDNSDGRLLPYLTANVIFETDRRDDILLAPNAALRWQPAEEQIHPEYRTIRETSQQQEPGKKEKSVVWIPQDGYVRPLPVRTGITDGIQTEVVGDGISSGTEVVVGIRADSKRKQKGQSDTPFMTNLSDLPSRPGN